MNIEKLYFATAAKGIETLLAEELRALGIEGVKETRAGVFFSGELSDAYKVCLWSRVANRVLLPLAKFEATDEDMLYAGVRAIDWSLHMDENLTLAIDASVSNSNITHSQYAAFKTKDAIVDFFRDEIGVRPSVEVDQPDLQINLYLNNNEAQLYIDLSGDSLHLRGYRTRGSVAPLKENLAAAILYRAKWPEIANQGGAFVDFMCGSGTLPIEAAMMACDIAPGLGRTYFGFLGWLGHDEAAWSTLKTEAEIRRETGLLNAPNICGFDHHHATINRAQQHIRQAGLEGIVNIEYQDLMEFDKTFSGHGLVVVNPPYGKRLGEADDLSALYAGIGQVLKTHFMGWKAAVFTDDQAKGKSVGIRANKIHLLYNGALACKLLHFDVNENEIFQDFRLPKFVPIAELSSQSEGFRNRLNKNLKQMRRWATQNDVHCFRIYDADLPDYAVAIDLYSHDNQQAKIWVNIQEYEAPKSIDPAKAKWRLREVVTIVKKLLQVENEQLILKSRRRQKGNSQYEKLANEHNYKEVTEGNCRFWVNFEDYLDTGLFLDHRPVRQRIQNLSQGKTFLNLFAYTGAVTVHAAKGGARNTLTIDMSKTYLDWARRNMRLNRLENKDHDYLQADCLNWLAHPIMPVNCKNKSFDIIFLDPPSFSNSKRMLKAFDVQKDHVTIVQQAMKLLDSEGVMFFSNNLRSFKLDPALLSMFAVVDITDESVPRDFKQRVHIHKCWELRHK